MDITTIWVGIIIPILVGPLFIFIKNFYDKYTEKIDERRLIEFNEKKNDIKQKLDKFFWPLYLKLLCIYRLNYNIPEYSSDEYSSENLSTSSFEFDDKILKRTKCIGYVFNNSIFPCNKFIIRENRFLLCKKCLKKCNNLNIDKIKNKELITEAKINRNINLEDIRIQIPKYETDENESDNSSPDITGNGIGNVTELPTLEISIDEETLKTLEIFINKYYKECSSIINNYIYICNPNDKLGKELINFLKYCSLREVIHEGTIKQKYSLKKFCGKNNLNTLLSVVETILYDLQKDYKKLVKNGPYNLN